MSASSMETQHFSHNHPLFFNDQEPKSRVFCYGCQQPISEAPSYDCRRCSHFSLHKSCAELPTKMEDHPLHPKHPLSLLANPPYPRQNCRACQRSCDSFTYNCFPCDFSLDPVCALMANKVEFSFHQHPLTLLQRPALFLCDACGLEHKGASFRCDSCQFWINQKCASLPSKIEDGGHHEHCLSLAYSLPFDDYCCICDKKLKKVNWVYCCDECRFYAHVACATSKRKLSHRLAVKEKAAAEEIEPNLICLPWSDESVNGILSAMREINLLGDDKKDSVLYYVSHGHPLFSTDMQGSDDCCSGSKPFLCDGCSKPVSAPFYSCRDCNFSLHHDCAELPFKLRHPCHQEHPLVLYRWPSAYSRLQYCQACKMQCNGIFFGCLSCNFFVDLDCAFLHGSVQHEGHQHELFLRKALNAKCGACEYVCLSGIVLACGVCSFKVHLQCALLPRTVRHKCDEHPLTLTYSTCGDRSDEHYCEICDIEMDTNFWFYYCGNCTKSLQIPCIREADAKASSLFIIKHEGHVHPLSLDATLDFWCPGCNSNCNGIAFVCHSCNFKLHTRCALLPRTVKHRYDKHPYTLCYSGSQEEYYCDICEDEINQECWFYHCDFCNQSLHTTCIQVDEYTNVKIGDELRIEGHEHVLNYVRHSKGTSPCDHCGELVQGWGFVCGPCNFRLHFSCAHKAIRPTM